MTINQLKAEKAALVAKMNAAKNPVTAPNVSPAIRQSIIDSNLQRYKRQINAIQLQINIIMGRAEVPNSKPVPKFAASVLPENFAL